MASFWEFRDGHQRHSSGGEIPPFLSMGWTVGHQEQPLYVHMTKLYVRACPREITFPSVWPALVSHAIKISHWGMRDKKAKGTLPDCWSSSRALGCADVSDS